MHLQWLSPTSRACTVRRTGRDCRVGSRFPILLEPFFSQNCALPMLSCLNATYKSQMQQLFEAPVSTKITSSSHEVYKSWNLGCLWRLLSDFCWEMTDSHSSWHVAARTSFGSEMERLGWHFDVEAKTWCSCRSGQSVLCASDSGLWKICRHNVSILELQNNSGLLDIDLKTLFHYFYGISVCHLGALHLDLQERHRVQKVMGHVACCSYETLSVPSICCEWIFHCSSQLGNPCV